MRLIDADALIQSVGDKWTDYDIELVDSFPTIDAVPVVRCRECSRRYAKDFGQYCPSRVGPVRPDGYCDEGQRREDGDGDD